MLTEEELKLVFNGKRKTSVKQGFEDTTFDQFLNWFKTSNFEKGCRYCGTTNDQTYNLYIATRNKENNRNDWTRGGKRGKRLELDRLNPTLPYDEMLNLVWCCYWCNNAKSNFFTAEEFQPIANQIGLALKKIMQ